MSKSKVYHDQSSSFGLVDILANSISTEELERNGLKPRFNGGSIGDRFKLVALVDSDSLEVIFRLTNNIDHAWTENEGVWTIGTNHRSTSVGDLVQLGTGKWYICDMVGWREIEVETFKCEGCDADQSEDDSVQKKICKHILCEGCDPCPICEEIECK